MIQNKPVQSIIFQPQTLPQTFAAIFYVFKAYGAIKHLFFKHRFIKVNQLNQPEMSGIKKFIALNGILITATR